MKVLKFGGTSVGTPDSLSNVVSIASGLQEPAVIVVSALGGVTDRLIQTARDASEGNETYRKSIEELRCRHFEMINAMVLPEFRDEVLAFANEMLGQLSDICRGLSLVRELTERSQNMIVAFGERISSRIVAASIPGARHFDSLDLIRTERWIGRHIADKTATTALIKESFSQLSDFKVAVMGGFISRDKETDQITNLGRGGSDYTAALVAAALDAEVLEIWTDVDGFLTADPRLIPEAQVLPELSFVESMELCSFGAKVIYPPTIYPVFERGIPIKILNTFRPEAPGTLISDHSSTQKQCCVHGITALRQCVLIEIFGEAIANIADSNARIFNTLTKKGISVLLVSQTASVATIAFAVRGNDLQRTIDSLRVEFGPELSTGQIRDINATENVEVVAVVGENIGQNFAIRSRIFNTLEQSGIPLLAAAFGNSLTTVSFVTAADKANDAMKYLHTELI